MPNENEIYESKQKKRIKEITTGETRIATNLSDHQVEAEKKQFYDINATISENKFIEEMLKDQQLDAFDKNRLMNVQERNMSHLLLNSEKFTGDSDYMKNVKQSVRWLEVSLSMNISSREDLVVTRKAYGTAIQACYNYVQNKNPWFFTGRERKKRVKERLSRLEKERDAFVNGEALIVEGKVDINAVKKSSDLLTAYRNYISQGNKMVEGAGVHFYKDVDKSEILTQPLNHKSNTKDTYNMPKYDPDSSKLSDHQKEFRLSSVRGAITELIGRERYSGFDQAVSIENKETQKVKLHHALGTRLVNEGQEVVEIDCAGSTFKQFRKEHKGFSGKGEQLKGKLFEKTYGTDYMTGEEKQKGILEKTKDFENGKEIPRYTIQGPNVINATSGKFDIDGISNHVYDLVTYYIKKYLESPEWQAKPRVVNINIQGHSRGGVGETIGIKRVMDWLDKEYIPQSPKLSAFRQYIKINMIEHDPVAGGDVSNKYRNHDLRDEKGRPREGLNTTTVYSMHCDRPRGFAPIQVRGQQRIILMAEKHGVGLDSIDTSQKNVEGDQKFHRPPLFDSKTGEAYRGSGYNELPKGVFIRDENGAIVRMRSYAEAEKVFNQVIKNAGGQNPRHIRTLRAVKQWFIDNEYVDETMTLDEVRKMGLAVRDRTKPDSAFSVLFDDALASDKEFLAIRRLVETAEASEHINNKDYIGVLQMLEKVNYPIRQYMEKIETTTEENKKKLRAVSEILSLYRAEEEFCKKQFDERN